MARRVPIVVTDGEERAALAVVRSLGRVGHSVHVCAARTPSLAGASRFAVSEHQTPDPLASPDLYAAAVKERIAATGASVLLPTTEASLLALLPRRRALGRVQIPWPDAERFSRISDKAEVLQRAADLGLHVPAQRRVLTPADLLAEETEALPFPLVLKPARSVAGPEGRKRRLGVLYAASPEELEALAGRLPPEAFPLLLQQRIEGPGIGVFLLPWGGKLLATFAHRRIREKPPSGGVSVYRESVIADSALVEQSRRLLEAFDWMGVAMVEYKVDERTGQPCVMEVNGRFWGSLQLAVDAGVDFPVLLVSAVLGDQPEPVRVYRPGIRSRWWWGDVDQLLSLWRGMPKELSLPANSPGRWRALRDFLLLWQPGDRSEILRASDPRPFLRESADWLRKVVLRS